MFLLFSSKCIKQFSIYIGQKVTHQSTCWEGWILQNTAIVCKVTCRLFNIQALCILPMACIIQIIAKTLLLEFGFQQNLFSTSTCLSLIDFFVWNIHNEQEVQKLK